MRGSLLLNFSEFVENHGADFVSVTVNNQVRKVTATECTNEFMTYINTGDVVNIHLTPNSSYTGSTKEISVSRKDFTTDNEYGDFGIKDTFIQSTSGTTYYLDTTFTATTRSDAYNFQYVVTVESCNTPILTSSLTPSATCSSSTFNYTPTFNVGGTTYTWTRNTVSGISNTATSGTTAISETLINTTNAPISVPYVFNIFTEPGCTNSQTVTEVINPRPYIQNNSVSVCSESTFTITPTNGSGNIVPTGTTYTWTVSTNSNVTGQTNQSIPQSSISQTLTNLTIQPQTLIYTITPISPQGCTGNTFTMSVETNPKVTNPQTSGTIYNNQTIDMTPVMTGSTVVPTGTTYTWTYSPITGVTGMTTQTIPVTGITQTLTNTTTSRKTITYLITATTPSGCVTIYTYNVLLYADQVTVVLGNPNVSSWTAPSSITEVTVECWGGGGKGGVAGPAEFVSYGRSRAGGGGGGAYAKSTIPVIGGTSYPIQIGFWNKSYGTDTWFINDTTVMAKGGANGQATSLSNLGIGLGGAGGSSTLSVGTVKYRGGNGASGGSSSSNYSGGAGGSAGTAGDGSSGSTYFGGYGGTGDKPGGGVGKGGDGRINTTGGGQNGSLYGSGGGGGLCSANTGPGSGGDGVAGVIALSYYL